MSNIKHSNKIKTKLYQRTKRGLVSRIYNSQKFNSKRRGHLPPTYTRVELEEWLFSQTLFHKLYDEWVGSGYETLLKPSPDRKDDNVGYTIKGIQLMTWGENKAKGHNYMRKGKIIHGNNPQRKVRQFTKDNIFMAEFHSINEAMRETKVSKVWECCNGNRKTAGGFKWAYAT